MLRQTPLLLISLVLACAPAEPPGEAPGVEPVAPDAAGGGGGDDVDEPMLGFPSTPEFIGASCPSLVLEEPEAVVVMEPGGEAFVSLALRNPCTTGPSLRVESLDLVDPLGGFELLSELDELELGPGETGSVQLRFAPSAAGLYVADLTLNTNDARVPAVTATLFGLTGAETVSGAAPVADNGGNVSVTTGSTVTLDGSGSSDPEGDTLSYSWSFQAVASGSALGNGDITNPTSAVASFVPDVDGSYRIRFVVSDGTSIHKVFHWVWAGSATNNPPVAEAGPTINAVTGTAANLDGTASSDPDGDSLTWSWSFQSVPAGSAVTTSSYDDNTSSTPSFTPDVDGDYRVRMVVSDGVEVDKDFVWVRSGPLNTAPSAEAGVSQTGITGEVHTMDGTASSDPDGDALTWSWSWKTLPAGSSLVRADIIDLDTSTPSFTSDVDGTYRLRMVVSDGTDVGKDFVNVTTHTEGSYGSGASATGTSGTHAPSFLIGQQVSLSSAITLSGLGIGIDSGSGNAVVALYEDSGGAPGAMVAQTGSEAVSAGSNSLSLSGGEVSLVAGTYWIMKAHDDVAYVTESSADGTGNGTAWTAFTYSSSVPDPAGSTESLDDHLMALWLVGY